MVMMNASRVLIDEGGVCIYSSSWFHLQFHGLSKRYERISTDDENRFTQALFYLILFSICLEVHQQADHHHICNKGRTSVTHKRKRQADHRHQSHRHAGIDDYMGGENPRNADCR